jgi:hypothetical protein
MAHVRSTTRFADGATCGGSGGEGRKSGGSERTESAQWCDAGSRSEVGDVVDEGARSRRWIHGVIDSGYFSEGMGYEPGKETVLEPNPDEVVVFEEFFTT